jgi:hypothetical protein
MKKTMMILLMVATVSATSLYAQGGKPEQVKKEKKEEHLNKRITDLNSKLGLNQADSAKFWPVYIQMNEELKASRKKFKSEHPDMKLDEMTDDEIKKVINNGFAMRQNDLDIRKSYNDKFIALIGPKKVAELYMLEKKHHEGQKPGEGPKKPMDK